MYLQTELHWSVHCLAFPVSLWMNSLAEWLNYTASPKEQRQWKHFTFLWAEAVRISELPVRLPQFKESPVSNTITPSFHPIVQCTWVVTGLYLYANPLQCTADFAIKNLNFPFQFESDFLWQCEPSTYRVGLFRFLDLSFCRIFVQL